MFYSGRLAEAFSLCPADERVQDLLPDIRFFEAVRTSRRKHAMDERKEQGLATAADVQLMIAQLNTSVVATEDELAFYDALAVDPSAVEQMDGSLFARIARIAHELYEQIRRDVTVDWKVKEQVRDRIMARVLRLLRKYGYPPDKQPAAIERVLKQAEDMADKLS